MDLVKDEVAERPVGRTAHLLPSQWAWLDRRGLATQSRSASTELRVLVQTAMDAEGAEVAKAA